MYTGKSLAGYNVSYQTPLSVYIRVLHVVAKSIRRFVPLCIFSFHTKLLLYCLWFVVFPFQVVFQTFPAIFCFSRFT